MMTPSVLVLLATGTLVTASPECSAGGAKGTCAPVEVEVQELEETDLATTQMLQVKAKHSAESLGCPASTKYYALTKVCKDGFSELENRCPTMKYDFKCDTARYDFRNYCNTQAYSCYSAVSKLCKSSEGATEEAIDALGDKCKPVPVAFPCTYYGRKTRDRKQDICDEETGNALRSCPNTKMQPRCAGAAYAQKNLCDDAAEACEKQVRDVGFLCPDEMALAELSDCKVDYTFPEVDVLVPGKALSLEDGGVYKFFSVIGCQWKGTYCNMPLGVDGRNTDEVKLLRSTEHAVHWRLVATGEPDEFYIYKNTVVCDQKDEANGCYALSYSDTECPEAAWNPEYMDCVEAKMGVRYPKIPFTIKSMDGTDQYVIRTSATCPDGKRCGWQLSSNSESCGKKLPQGTIEALKFDNPWRLERVS